MFDLASGVVAQEALLVGVVVHGALFRERQAIYAGDLASCT